MLNLIAEMQQGTQLEKPEDIPEEAHLEPVREKLEQPSVLHHEQCDMMFRIRAETDPPRKPEPQRRMDAAARLAEHLRARVTLPAEFEAETNVQAKLDSGDRLPPVSCAFKQCSWSVLGIPVTASDVREGSEHPWDRRLRDHVLQKHQQQLLDAIDDPDEDYWDLYKQALAIKERQCIPVTGVSVDRRAFEYTLQVYNDETIRSLICCACARIRVDTGGPRSDIEFKRGGWLLSLPKGSLNKNFSMAEFEKKYRQAGTPLADRGKGERNPDFSE